MGCSDLKRECNGRKNIGYLCGKENFAKATVDESKRRYGINKNDEEGEDEKKERCGRELFCVEENVCNSRNGGKRCH